MRRLIRHGTLIDGTGADPVPDGAVLVQDGRIVAAGPASAIDADDADVVDAGGGWILPGFIDCHVHLMMQNFDQQRLLSTPFSTRFYDAVGTMRRTLDAGITSVRDAGGADAGLRHAVQEGLVEGPRMQVSISILSTTGGHLDWWLRSGTTIEVLPPYPGFPDGRCDGIHGPDGVRQRVREVLRAGADVIKVCATGGILSPTDHPDFVEFQPDELEDIVRTAAGRNGTPVMAHAQGAAGIRNAVEAGVRSIEHGIFLDDETIELMRRRGTFLVPTLLALQYILDLGAQGGVAPHVMQKARSSFDAHRESIRRAHEAGVRIAMGSDAGVMPHGTTLRELGLMTDCGLSPMEAIVAGTRSAAECMGWQDRVGTIETGKLADVIVSTNDPLESIESLGDPDTIVVVMKEGELVKDRR